MIIPEITKLFDTKNVIIEKIIPAKNTIIIEDNNEGDSKAVIKVSLGFEKTFIVI